MNKQDLYDAAKDVIYYRAMIGIVCGIIGAGAIVGMFLLMFVM